MLPIKKYYPFLLLLLSLPLYFMNISDVHAWGDDFAQYIQEAINIAHGKHFYLSNYVYNAYNTDYAPPQYPPGFPLMLAPVVKIWGMSFAAMCYFNTVILTLLLFALFAYFRKHTGTIIAICLSVIICYSRELLELKENVLADTPCLLFVTLYLLYRNAQQFSIRRISALIFFAVMAIQCRSQAIFLIAAEGIYAGLLFVTLLVRTRKPAVNTLAIKTTLFIIIGTIAINLFLDKIVFYAPVNTSSFYNNFFHKAQNWDLKKIAEEHINDLFHTISGFFYYDAQSGIRQAAVSLLSAIGLVFVFTGFIVTIFKRLNTEDIFFVLVCAITVFFPGRDIRYFLPALPIAFYYFYTVVKMVLKEIHRVNTDLAFVLLTTLFLAAGYEYFKVAATAIPVGIPRENDKKAIAYISTHVSDRDLIVFLKPRMLTLFTGKRSMNYAWQISADMNKKVFDSMQAKYLLTFDGFDDPFSKTYLHETAHPIDSTKIAEGYTLYTLK